MVLLKQKPACDPAREALRTAIAQKAELQAVADRQRAAVQRAMTAMQDAVSAVAQAERDVEAAKRGHAKSMAGAFTAGNEAALDSRTVRDARLALADAEDRRDAAQSALDQLHTDLGEKAAAADSSSVRSAIDDAMMQVMKPTLAEMIRRGIEGRRDYLTAKAAVHFLQHKRAIPPGLADEISGLFAWQLPFPDDSAHAMPACDAQAVTQGPLSAAAWQRTLETLRQDADAALPEAK